MVSLGDTINCADDVILCVFHMPAHTPGPRTRRGFYMCVRACVMWSSFWIALRRWKPCGLLCSVFLPQLKIGRGSIVDAHTVDVDGTHYKCKNILVRPLLSMQPLTSEKFAQHTPIKLWRS